MTTPEATSFQVRAELEDLLERDLLGPWDGPEEELPPGTSPAERYMLGRLVPRQQPEEPADDEELEPELVDREVASPASGDDGEEEGAEADATVRSGSMSASAIGLAFSVPATVDVISVVAKWGRYERSPSETHETPTGRGRDYLAPGPGGRVRRGAGPTPRGRTRSSRTTSSRALLSGTRCGTAGARRVVELALVNGQRTPAQTQDTARLYQVGLTVTALDGNAAIFLGHNDPDIAEPPPGSDDERLHLELLHRATRKYANGRQCAVDAAVRDGETRAWQLSTTCFPSAEVQLVVPGKVPGLVLDMARLGSPELGRDDLVRALRPLVTGYRKWLTEQASRVESDPEIARYGDAGQRAVAAARDVAGRLERAIELLRTDGIAREAFRFANQAMALQRVRSEVVRARMSAPGADVAGLLRRLDVPENRSLAAVPARVRAAVPAGADRSRRMPTRTGVLATRWTPKSSCCSSRPVAARPRRTWGSRRTRSRSGGCRAWSGRVLTPMTGRAGSRC